MPGNLPNLQKATAARTAAATARAEAALTAMIKAWRPATSVDSDHTRITGHRRNPDGDEVPEVRRRL